MPKGVLYVQNFCFAYYMTISVKNQQFDGKYEMKMTSAVTHRESQIWVNSSSYPLELNSSPWCASCSRSARSAWGGRCRGWIGSRIGPCVWRGSQLLCLILQVAICLWRVFHLSCTKIHVCHYVHMLLFLAYKHQSSCKNQRKNPMINPLTWKFKIHVDNISYSMLMTDCAFHRYLIKQLQILLAQHPPGSCLITIFFLSLNFAIARDSHNP